MTDIQEANRTNELFERIAALIEQSRQFVVSAVNVAEESFENEIVTNCGNGVASIRLLRFTLSWSHYLI